MKKKPEEMTSEEVLEEFKKMTKKLEKLAPKLVGDLVRINEKYYALTKDETGRKVLMEPLRQMKT